MPKIVKDSKLIEQLEAPRKAAFGDGEKTRAIIEAPKQMD